MTTESSQTKPWSRSAITSAVLGAICFTGIGILALPVGLIGLWKTSGGSRRGRQAAKYGVGLGMLSLCFNFLGCPVVFLPPPVHPEDRTFSTFITDLGRSRLDQLRGNIRVANSNDKSSTEFARWAEAFNRQNGAGKLLWPAMQTWAADSAHIYFVYFEKTGICRVEMYSDSDANGWILFFPRSATSVEDFKYSDRYNNDPEFREIVGQGSKSN